MNRTIISGNLTKDPELRYTGNNMAVCTFTVALNRGKDRDGNDRGADFPRVIAFGKSAENIERYLSKGQKILVEGHIHTGSYENKEGQKIYTTDIIVDRWEFAGGGQQNRPTQGAGQAGTQMSSPQQQEWKTQQPANDYVPSGFSVVDEDDIPF